MRYNSIKCCVIRGEFREDLYPLEKKDYIDDCFTKSLLKVYEYYMFYGMVSGLYNEQYVKEVDEYIIEQKLEEYYNQTISNLPLSVQLVVRMFISRKKNATIILLHDLDGIIKEEEIEII